MLTNNLVPCFVQTFKTDSKTGYEKALLVGVFDKTSYEVGDSIVFNVVADDCHSFEEAVRHPLNGATYRIDYILDDFEGLAQKYVALAISKED